MPLWYHDDMPIKMKRNRKKSWPRGVLAHEQKSGTVLLEVTVPGTDGSKRRRKVVKLENGNFLNAEAEVLKFRREVAQEFPTAPWEFVVEQANVSQTFSEFVALNRSLLLGGLSPHRKELEEAILDTHLIPFFGNVLLGEITDQHLDAFLLVIAEKRYERKGTQRAYSAAYINTVQRVLRKVLHRAVQYRAIPSFPFLAKNRWKTEKLVKNELSTEERIAFLAAFDDKAGFKAALEADGIKVHTIWGGFDAYFRRFAALKPLFVAAIHSGLRQADLMDLRWTDIRGTTIERVMNKEKERHALIPISTTLAASLATIKRRGPYVFHIDGKKLPLSTVKRYFRLAVKIAAIPHPVRFHDLRHTCGSTLASNGTPLPVIQKIMGHASAATTQRYAKPSEEAVKAMSVFD